MKLEGTKILRTQMNFFGKMFFLSFGSNLLWAYFFYGVFSKDNTLSTSIGSMILIYGINGTLTITSFMLFLYLRRMWKENLILEETLQKN